MDAQECAATATTTAVASLATMPFPHHPSADVHLLVAALNRLLRFPKPQLLVYSLLVVPVVYGGAKLIAGAQAMTESQNKNWWDAEAATGVACIVVLPLPVLIFWSYVLWTCRNASTDGSPHDAGLRRSRSSILRTYQRASAAGGTTSSPAVPSHATYQGVSLGQRGTATIALLGGDSSDSPTLVIRARQPGEDELDADALARGTSSSSEGPLPATGHAQHTTSSRAAAGFGLAGRPWRLPAGGASGV